MSEIASAFVSLLPSAKGFGSKMEGELDGEVKGAGKRLGTGFGKMFAVAGGVLAAAGIGSLLKDSIGEAREAQKVGALTESIIKSTGGAAKITADQVGALASAISLKTGMDDEAIQTGANLLLTFKNVRNEVGKGSDVFNRATQAATDLSAAGFGDMAGQSKMLGKALNDPIKGISALSRSGVTFSEQQKEQIKTLVESGNTLKAQKIILGEVESQVGGAAAATATAGEKASIAFGNLKEDAGTALLPVIDKLANRFTALSPAISRGVGKVGPLFARAQRILAPFVAQVREQLLPAATAFGVAVATNVMPAVRFLLPIVKDMATAIATNLVPAIVGVLGFLVEFQGAVKILAVVIAVALIPVIISSGVAAVRAWGLARIAAVKSSAAQVAAHYRTVAGWALSSAAAIKSGAETAIIWAMLKKDAISAAATQVAAQVRAAAAYALSTAAMTVQRVASIATAAATKAMAAAQWLLNAALTANPIGLVVAAIVLLVAAFVVAYKKSETFRNIVDKAFAGIKSAARAVANFFTKKIPAAFQVVVTAAGKALGWVKSNWPLILAVLTGPFGLAVLAITKNWDKIIAGGKKVFTFIKSIPGRITGALGDLGSLLLDAGNSVIDGLWNGLKNKWEDVKDWFGDITSKIPDLKGPAKRDGKLLTPAGRLIMRGLLNGLRSGEGGLEKFLGNITEKIGKALDNKEITKKAANRMRATVDAVGRELTRLGKKYDKAQEKLKKFYDDRLSMALGISSSIQGELDLGSTVTTSEPNQFGFGGGKSSTTFAAVSGAVAGLASRARTFAKRLKALLKAGIPRGLVQEVAGLGSQQGIAVANALLTGTKGQIRDLSTNYSAIGVYGNIAGDAVAGAFFDTGIAAQKGLIRGLLKDDALTVAANTLAKKMTKKVRTALGINSRSNGKRVLVPRISHEDTTPRRGMTAGDVARAVGGMKVEVDVGLDRRTQARIVQNGTAGMKRWE